MLRQKERKLSSLFLDLDGPLLDVSERYYRVYREIIEGLGGSSLRREDYWRHKRAKTALGEMLRLSGVSRREAGCFRKQWLQHVEEKRFLLYDRVWPGASKILAKLSRSYELILITLRRSPANLGWQLKRLGLGGYFSGLLCRKDNKGNWQVKYRLLKGAGLRGGRIFLIGDTEVDVVAGKKSGYKTIALLCGVRKRDVLSRYKPDYIFTSLREASKVLI